MIYQSPKKAEIFLLAFRREIAPDPPTRIYHSRARGLCQGMKMQHPTPGNGRFPGCIVHVKKLSRNRFVNGIQPCFLL